MNLQNLLASVRRRTTHRGISTAAPFLRELTACLGGVCPSKVLGDISADAWDTMLKEAESRLVYHADDMAIGDDSDAIKAAQGNALPPHTIATFPAVITTTRQDRDGDVLETKGAELDPAAPLLWQHLTTEPIGRLLKEGKRTKTSLTGSFAIAATALGQDAALLAEHGALRISHGFLPDEFEPLDAKDAFSGFHITAFKILEVSLVSVPSNPDAVITQFSREKLHHPLVRAWAGAMFDARPVLVSGGVGRNCGSRIADRGFEIQSAIRNSQSEISPLALGHPPSAKRRDSPPTKWCVKMLKKSLGHCAAIAANPDATTLIADEATKAQGHIQDVIETMEPEDKTLHRQAARDGEWPESPTGDAVRLESLTYKSGRVFSAANEKRLQAAAANYKAIANDDEAHPDVARLADKGYRCVKGLFDTGGDSGDGQDDLNAYTVDGPSGADRTGGNRQSHAAKGKSGRAVSAENAAVIQEAIAHGRAIKSHDESTPGHKSMAKTAIKKLKAVLDGKQEPLTDPEDDMSDGGGSGAPIGMAPDAGAANSIAASCKRLLATAMGRFAATNELRELKTLGQALRNTRRKVDGAISRIERQREHDDESAALAEIVSEFGR
ncbi:MAG TPA: HK97 family phage prohead protease [Pirellulales bacterium]|nr:HK97 family phage prohead protease [Pirellulales bacterium]